MSATTATAGRCCTIGACTNPATICLDAAEYRYRCGDHESAIAGETFIICDPAAFGVTLYATTGESVTMTHEELDDLVRRLSAPTWTDVWPDVPGYYWTWDGKIMSPGRVMTIGGGASLSVAHAVGGSFAYPREWPGLVWGPRIDMPAPPAGES